MKKVLSENEMKMIEQLTAEIRNEANEELSREENMQISLASRVEDIDEQKEVADICNGIREFDEVMSQLEEGDRVEHIMYVIDSSGLQDKIIKEQFAILAESMEAFQADLISRGYDLGELKELKIEKDREVTEEDLHKLKNQVAQYLDKFALLHGDIEILESFYTSIGIEDAEKILKTSENEDEAYYLALAVRILEIQGKIEEIPFETGAREIGIDIAASMAYARAYLRGILGKIPWEEVLGQLKKIASAALTLLTAAAGGIVAYEAGKTVFLLSLGIFGNSLIGIGAAVVLASAGMYTSAVLFARVWQGIKENDEGADGYIQDRWEDVKEEIFIVRRWIKEEALPALGQFWENLKEKVACFIEKHLHRGTHEEEMEEFEDYEEEDENTVKA